MLETSVFFVTRIRVAMLMRMGKEYLFALKGVEVWILTYSLYASRFDSIGFKSIGIIKEMAPHGVHARFMN